MINNVLQRQWVSDVGNTTEYQIVIPKCLKEYILKQLHDNATSGNLGVKKTLRKVRQRFYWYGLRKNVELYCKKCKVCASKKNALKAI
jgi:hypothetical protein